MAKVLFFVCFVCLSVEFAVCQEKKKLPSPNSVFWWSFFVPGGGYFAQGEPGRGLGYFLGTAGFLSWGIALDQKKAGEEINAPLLYAQQLHGTQIYLAYRQAVSKTSEELEKRNKKMLLDQSSFSSLALSPFRTENLKNPWVIGFGLFGAGINYVIARFAATEKDFSDIASVQILGEQFGRTRGFGIHSAYWIPLSLGAALSEEAIFRGMIQTEWEERWGKKKGLLSTSALFGFAHFTGKKESLGNVFFAMAAGLFLGWRFQERNYQLSELIAEHFWFDAIAGTTLYFADPENNPLGAKVEFIF